MFVFSRVYVLRAVMQRFSREYSPIKTLGETSVASSILDIVPDHVVQALETDGLYRGIVIPPVMLTEILDFAQTATYLGHGDPQFLFSLADRRLQESQTGHSFRIAYSFEPASQCAAIQTLAMDPKLWEIAAKYLQGQPVIACTQLWWTFVKDTPDEGRGQGFYRFHYDLEDYACVKFMFYLTEVNQVSGPHLCVKGSHKKKKLSYQFSLLRERSDEEIADYYGDENIVTIL